MRATSFRLDDEEDFFDMANLAPEDTGLPMVVWVSQRGAAWPDARVKVSLVHGRHFKVGKTTSVTIRLSARVIAGPELSPPDLQAVTRWIDLNRQTLLDFWEEKLSTREMLDRIQKI